MTPARHGEEGRCWRNQEPHVEALEGTSPRPAESLCPNDRREDERERGEGEGGGGGRARRNTKVSRVEWVVEEKIKVSYGLLDQS